MTTLTMQDIANLAKVSRPAVSQWRKRDSIRGVSMPFPSAVDTVAGVERFDRAQVVDWLERTGRGKNRDEQVLDAPALTVPDGLAFDDVALLLAMAAIADVDFETADHRSLISAAVAADPRDELLQREIRDATPSDELLRYTTELVGASYGIPDAYRRLEEGRLGRDRGLRGLTEEAVTLLRTIVRAAALHLDADDVALIPAGDPEVAVLIAESGDRLTVTGESAQDRAIKRRAVIEGLNLDNGSNGGRVRVASLVGLEGDRALESLDDVALDLADGEIAVILGPATELTDDLTGPLAEQRNEILKVGNLIAALRLPPTLWREAHRKSLAVWVCCGGVHIETAGIADLAFGDPVTAADLAADIGAVLGDRKARSFRYLRARDLHRLRGGRALVPRGVRAQRLRSSDSGAYAARVDAATLITSVPVQTLDLLVAGRPGGLWVAEVSLDELRERGHLTVISGNRFDPDHADPAGTVPVLPDGELRFDPLDLAERYPRARRTEPGDVVIVTKPSPHACVDPIGGSLVAAPAKILRLSKDAPFGPQVLTAAINARAESGTDWRAWPIPDLRSGEGDRLEAALAEVAGYREALQGKLAAAEELALALIDGVGAGAISLAAEATTDGISATRHVAVP